MASPTSLDDEVLTEDDHWCRENSLASPASNLDIGFDNGIFQNFSSQQSRKLNSRTGGSSSHGDGPHGDELRGSELSDEVISVVSEKKTAEQGEPGLLSANIGTFEDRQELQKGVDKVTDGSSGVIASDQASAPSGDDGGGTDVTKKSATDKSYVPSSGCGSPKPSGKRKLARSMRGTSQMYTRSRARLGDTGNENIAPPNATRADPVRSSDAEGGKRKKPGVPHKRVAKKPFGSGETRLEPHLADNKPPTRPGASQVRGSNSESPGSRSSASSNCQQYVACKDAASGATTGKAPDMSIYDVEGSPEPEKPEPRKTAAKGRSKTRTKAAPAPTTAGLMQSAKKAPSRKRHAAAGPQTQEKSQGNKKLKPLQTYGRAVAKEVVDVSSPERTAIPNSKRRRSRAGQKTTERPSKKLKVEDDTKATSFQDLQAFSEPGKLHNISSHDVDDEDGNVEHEGTLYLRPNPDLPRTRCHTVNPAELGTTAEYGSTQRLTARGTILLASAKADHPLEPVLTSGQKQNGTLQSRADLGDTKEPLPLQLVSHLPNSRHHSPILKATSINPTSTLSENGKFPRIGQETQDPDHSERFAPLFSGQNEQRLEAPPISTAGQRDSHQNSLYLLHPRSMAFQQKLSSMQAAREKQQAGSKETNHIQLQAAKDHESPRTTTYNDPLKGKNRWQAAVDETSKGLADTMHAITSTVLRELTSKEASIDSIVKEYSLNGAMIAANSFRRQNEERERAIARFEPACINLSQAFSCANDESMEIQTELSSKMRSLRQLLTKRRGNHEDIMTMDSIKSVTRGGVRDEK